MPGEYDHLFKIIIIGDANSGKTALLAKLADNHYSPTYIATIGVDFKNRDYDINDKKIRLRIWDTSGQEKFETIRKAYYHNTQAVIVYCNLTNEESFKNIDKWVTEAKNLCPKNALLFLVGTHSDEQDKLVVTEEELQEKAGELGCQGSFIVSAKTGENVEETFISVARSIATTILNKYAPQEQSTLQAEPATISREKLHQTYCKHITGPSIFSNTRSNIFGFFNGNDRPVDEIIKDLKMRANDHDGASRETCEELGIEYNQTSHKPR